MSEFLAEDVVDGQRVITTKNIEGTVQQNNAYSTDVLVEVDDGVYQRCIAVKDFGGGSGGTTDYSVLENKPQINDVTLSGNKSSADLGLQDELVSGTNIKTINGSSILGNGNLSVDDPNTYKSLSQAQETTLLTDGTYNGQEVENGTIFTVYDGTFKQFSEEESSGIETGNYTGGIQTMGSFKGTCFSVNASGNFNLLTSSDGKVWDSTGKYMSIDGGTDVINGGNSNVWFVFRRQTSSTWAVLKTTDGTDWDNGTITFPNEVPKFNTCLNFNDIIILCDNGTQNVYCYSDDDGDNWDEGSFPAEVSGNRWMYVIGNKLILRDSTGQVFEADSSFNWTKTGTTSLTTDGIVAGDYYMYEDGMLLYYSTDMINANYVDFPLSTSSGYTIAYSNGVYAVYNNQYVSISSDGLQTFTTETQYNSNYTTGCTAIVTNRFIECVATYWNAQNGYYGIIMTAPVLKLKDLSGVGTGANAPTSSTEGYIGKLFVTTGGAVYICTGVSGSTYTWSQITVS